MTARFVHVGINSTAPPVKALEKTFTIALDWVRYGTRCWILYTKKDLDTWRDRIRNTPGVKSGDSFFLCEFSEYSGYQHKVVWDFMSKHQLTLSCENAENSN